VEIRAIASVGRVAVDQEIGARSDPDAIVVSGGSTDQNAGDGRPVEDALGGDGAGGLDQVLAPLVDTSAIEDEALNLGGIESNEPFSWVELSIAIDVLDDEERFAVRGIAFGKPLVDPGLSPPIAIEVDKEPVASGLEAFVAVLQLAAREIDHRRPIEHSEPLVVVDLTVVVEIDAIDAGGEATVAVDVSPAVRPSVGTEEGRMEDVDRRIQHGDRRPRSVDTAVGVPPSSNRSDLAGRHLEWALQSRSNGDRDASNARETFESVECTPFDRGCVHVPDLPIRAVGTTLESNALEAMQSGWSERGLQENARVIWVRIGVRIGDEVLESRTLLASELSSEP
jgi:hypothetical protein